jgi:hypothetical protein
MLLHPYLDVISLEIPVPQSSGLVRKGWPRNVWTLLSSGLLLHVVLVDGCVYCRQTHFLLPVRRRQRVFLLLLYLFSTLHGDTRRNICAHRPGNVASHRKVLWLSDLCGHHFVVPVHYY